MDLMDFSNSSQEFESEVQPLFENLLNFVNDKNETDEYSNEYYDADRLLYYLNGKNESQDEENLEAQVDFPVEEQELYPQLSPPRPDSENSSPNIQLPNLKQNASATKSLAENNEINPHVENQVARDHSEQKPELSATNMDKINAPAPPPTNTNKKPRYEPTAFQDLLQLIEPTPVGQDPYDFMEFEQPPSTLPKFEHLPRQTPKIDDIRPSVEEVTKQDAPSSSFIVNTEKRKRHKNRKKKKARARRARATRELNIELNNNVAAMWRRMNPGGTEEEMIETLSQLKSKVSRAGVEQRVTRQHAVNPPPLHVPATATVTSGYKSSLPSTSSQRNSYNSFNDFLFEDSSTAPVSYLYNPNLSLTKSLDPYALDRPSDLVSVELPNLFGSDLGEPSLLEVPPLTTEDTSPTFTMIENKRPKRQPKSAESRGEPKYPVTTSSGNAKATRNRKRSTGVSGSTRTSKAKAAAAAAAAAPPPPTKAEKNSIYDDDLFNLNADSKVSYGKYTALQERLQLIEPTPTGEDPYQIGEAEMREQSPIPKLMLQKTQGRLRIFTTASAAQVTATVTTTTTTRRNYDTTSTTASSSKKRVKTKAADPFASTICHVREKDAGLDEDQVLDVDNPDGELDWSTVFSNEKKGNETSLCDFSYGETSTNLANISMDINNLEFPDFFEPGPVNADSSSVAETAPAQQAAAKTRKRRARTTSLAGPLIQEKIAEPKRTTASKRGRKRAYSTAAPIKRRESTQAKAPAKRGRRAARGKIVVPGRMTNKEYNTCMGDPDLSWYLGLDPDIKKEDCDPTDNTSANVEVPRWRIKHYAPISDRQGIEDLDDKVFEKRHQKLEVEERRQLRWHLRRMREQRRVEHLRQRQRDHWGPIAIQNQPRGDYTVWPQPVRDIQYIEITNNLPVNAFGQDLPDLPDNKFVVPWVKTPKAPKPKALRRSTRSKTLH